MLIVIILEKVNRHNSLLLNNQINTGIVDKYNLPFDCMYQSWGV